MIRNRRALFLAIALAVAGGAGVILSAALIVWQQAPEVAAPETAAQEALLPPPNRGPDGLFVEAWFHPTTGDLARDAAAAAGEGKTLAIFWELDTCEFCAQLHNHDLRIPALNAYLSERFYAVQLDYQGNRPIRDFDGVTASERDMARRRRAKGTPTIEFVDADGTVLLRIPGYVQPAVLQGAFEFVDTGAYNQSNINDWLLAKGLL